MPGNDIEVMSYLHKFYRQVMRLKLCHIYVSFYRCNDVKVMSYLHKFL